MTGTKESSSSSGCAGNTSRAGTATGTGEAVRAGPCSDPVRMQAPQIARTSTKSGGVAEADGNRTRRERVAALPIGFEVRAGHQRRERFRRGLYCNSGDLRESGSAYGSPVRAICEQSSASRASRSGVKRDGQTRSRDRRPPTSGVDGLSAERTRSSNGELRAGHLPSQARRRARADLRVRKTAGRLQLKRSKVIEITGARHHTHDALVSWDVLLMDTYRVPFDPVERGRAVGRRALRRALSVLRAPQAALKSVPGTSSGNASRKNSNANSLTRANEAALIGSRL